MKKFHTILAMGIVYLLLSVNAQATLMVNQDNDGNTVESLSNSQGIITKPATFTNYNLDNFAVINMVCLFSPSCINGKTNTTNYLAEKDKTSSITVSNSIFKLFPDKLIGIYWRKAKTNKQEMKSVNSKSTSISFIKLLIFISSILALIVALKRVSKHIKSHIRSQMKLFYIKSMH